ncbi:mechanosensitive ion channel family protein [Pseudoxanthomonas dokdonensis]|uniref:mechanosensitive ion channel family protein n=1 Tax=Pseudoxanthomonas dokdonensis TaxID=344882 RepID=UPI0014777301|nr:mechanosensitive ion channel domain-containing protein [Pseudoxanthomonas dokdonensis]
MKAIEANGWGHVLLPYVIKLVAALVILYVGIRMARWIAGISSRAMERANLDTTAVLFLNKLVYVILLVLVVLTIMPIFGIPVTSFFAVLGAAGLAIGLALKDSLSNVASGVMLVSLKPFRVGNLVTIAGETGKVESVSIFQTTLRGADNQTIVLPNSLITADSIINLTPDVMRRIELVVGISYSASIAKARGIALDVMSQDQRILAEPPADVLVYELADNSVNLGIRCHVANADFFLTKCELLEKIKLGFDEAGIGIPFPQRDVNLYHHLAQGNQSGNEQIKQSLQALTGEGVSLDSPDHKPSVDPQ